MIEFALREHNYQEIHLYWKARSSEGFYMPSLPVHWVSGDFHYHPVVSHPQEKKLNKGRHDYLIKSVLRNLPTFIDGDIFISGSPHMVYSVFDALLAEKIKPESIYSDVFEYAPRC